MTEVIPRYRAIGKLAKGHSAPQSTVDLLDEQDCRNTAIRLVLEGVWLEFYVKTVYSPRSERRAK